MKRNLVLIAAVSQDGVIGLKDSGDLPWSLPGDLAQFKKRTLSNRVIMGRKTFESIGRALPNRENFVLSRNPDIWSPCIWVYDSIESVVESIERYDGLINFLIGGAEIYKQALDLDLVSHAIITLVKTRLSYKYAGNCVFFPDWVDFPEKFNLESARSWPQGEYDEYEYEYLYYERKTDV